MPDLKHPELIKAIKAQAKRNRRKAVMINASPECNVLLAEAIKLCAKIEQLRVALEPFQRNVESRSLAGALGHIGREDIWNARKAYLSQP